jgi:16S rRNA (guanine(966)-N(2))-methyltransferase RsmD
MNRLFTTITAGKYKGKKLLLPSLASTRSTKSILKGSYFDSLQFDIIDANFVEVFGGSGSMGLEALSRGAKRAYFIEIDKEAYAVLKENTAAIDRQATRLYHGDSFKEFEKVLSDLPNEEHNTLFYFDPPFSIRDGMQDIYDKTCRLIASIPPKITMRIAIEHDSAIKFDDEIGPYKKHKTKKFGKSSLTFYALQ